MTAFMDSYPVIESYEKFKELVNDRGLALLQEKEPNYCGRFRNCQTIGLNASKTLEECTPLLSGKFDRFLDLLESIYEVGYYWKRLTETARLLEINVPVTPLRQMEEASWFIYNLDFYWHTDYGLQERLIRFLTIFKRMYKSPTPEDKESLETYIKAFKMLKTKATSVVRDPLAHYRSQGVQGWRNDHHWEAALLLDVKSDFMEIYDRNYLKHKDSYLNYVRKWMSQHGETLSNIFDSLCTFSLDKLGLE
jgi:hypothetical protein